MQEKDKLEFLNGLRGWAAFIVLLHHTLFTSLGNVNPIFTGKAFAFATDGRLSVFIFFILSGFVLSIKFIRRPVGESLALAATSRYFRLAIPIAVTSFLTYVLMSKGLMFNQQASLVVPKGSGPNEWLASFYTFVPSFKSYLAFSFYNVFFHYGDPTYNTNLWTMPYEFEGSMLIYFILGVFKKEKPNHLFMLAVLIAAAAFFIESPPLSCFLFGYLLAEAYYHGKPFIDRWKYRDLFFGSLGVMTVLLSTFYRPTEDRYIGALALVAVSSATFCRPLQRLFSSRVSQFMGKISFPLYLVHFIIFCSFSSYLLVALAGRGVALGAASYIVAALTTVVSMAVAYALLPLENLSVRASKLISRKLLGIDWKFEARTKGEGVSA